MAIRKILVPLIGAEGEDEVLRVAFAQGRRFGAHVEGLHVTVDPRDAVGVLGEGMTAAMLTQIIDTAERENRARGARVKIEFDRVCKEIAVAQIAVPHPNAGFCGGFVERVGPEEDVVAERGRLADLIVAPQQPLEPPPTPSRLLETVLRETGRPVLVVPRGANGLLFGQRVAIAWNGSLQAARAVRTALPWLREAERVTILSVEESGGFGPPGADLAEYLGWHDVTASVEALPAPAAGVGRALLERVDALGADFLVMGAYTRSQLRRLIFGGVTSEVLNDAKVPVLMVH